MVNFRIITKRTHNAAPERQYLDGDRPVTGLSPDSIHGPQEVEHLPADRGIRFERKPIKVHREAFDGPVRRHVKEPGLEFQITPPFDFDVSCHLASSAPERVRPPCR